MTNSSPQDGSRLRGALVVLPAAGGDAKRLLRSLDAAKAVGKGDFSEIAVLDVAAGERRSALATAAEEAARGDFDWLLATTAGETLAPDIFAKTAPALRVRDAVWGGAALAAAGMPARFERITRLAAQDFPGFFHAALAWWIGPSHFVRPALAVEAFRTADTSGPAVLRTADTSGWYADYMLALWKEHRAYKTAQCLTHFRGSVPPLAEADRARLVEFLEAEPVFMTVRHGASELKLPYTGLNPVIEREQMRGLFFEEEELRFLSARFPRGLRIVDAGANTGNHTLFFASVMQAALVTPIEPVARACAAIRAVVAENGLTNVDLSCLGHAIGASSGRLRPVPSVTAGLGAMHFAEDSEGAIPRVTLDALVNGRVDLLKIDVEGMEMEALAGAAGLIAAQHPSLYVEVLDARIGEFMAWVDRNGYVVEKLFPDKTHCNYLLVPRKSIRG
jgi:FkbM family methyltransferase